MQSPAPISILLNEGIYLIKELNLCNNKRKKKYFQHVLWDKLNQRYPDTLIYRIPHLNILLRVLEGGGRTSGSYPVEQEEGSKEGALTHLGKPALAGSNNINDSVSRAITTLLVLDSASSIQQMKISCLYKWSTSSTLITV